MKMRSGYLQIILGLLAVVLVTGCSSTAMKQRKEQRDKVAGSARLYCEWINGEIYSDIDVAVNLEMAKRCDADKPFSITAYRTPSENNGVMYCCSTTNSVMAAPAAASPSKPAAKASVEDKKEVTEEGSN